MSSGFRGFILQPTYRIEAGRAVVHLHGKLEDGRTFLVRDTRSVPHFYVDAEDAGRARELGVRTLEPTHQLTLGGRPVVRIEVPTPADTPPLRDRLMRSGIVCHEADVRFAMRYLIDSSIGAETAVRTEDFIDLCNHTRFAGAGPIWTDRSNAPSAVAVAAPTAMITSAGAVPAFT